MFENIKRWGWNIFVFITVVLWSILLTIILQKLGFISWRNAQAALVVVFFFCYLMYLFVAYECWCSIKGVCKAFYETYLREHFPFK